MALVGGALAKGAPPNKKAAKSDAVKHFHMGKEPLAVIMDSQGGNQG